METPNAAGQEFSVSRCYTLNMGAFENLLFPSTGMVYKIKMISNMRSMTSE